MYIFLLLALPLGTLLLFMRFYPREELIATRKAALFGLLAALPVWLLARLLGLALPPVWGSALFVFHEWADRFLPYALFPALGYAVFYHHGEHLPVGTAQRRLTAFYAGVLAPFGLGEAARAWGEPNAYTLFMLPLLIATIGIAAPPLVLAFVEEYGARRLIPLAVGLGATLAAAAVRWLFLARLWPLALALALGLAALAWLYAASGLAERSPAAGGGAV